MFEILDDIDFPDGNTVRVSRSFEDHGENFLQHAVLGTQSESPLFNNHASFLVDLLIIEQGIVRPVFHDLVSLIEQNTVVGWELKHIHRLIKTGVGIDVGSEFHPGLLQEIDQFIVGKRPVL